MSTHTNLNSKLEKTIAVLDKEQAGKRLFDKDARMWKTEPDQIKTINDGLGWLNLPQDFSKKTDELSTFADQLKSEGFTYAVLLGMGGSSLCSEVARETFGTKDGYMELLVLDNTSTEAINDLETKIDIQHTLFIAATKSGGTKETISFFKYFYKQLEQAGVSNPGNNFVAITDSGSPLEPMAREYKFRHTFINPSDVGGRYSVLSYFGLLPMALMGIDIKGFLDSALQMEAQCASTVPTAQNPGISLGAILGACQRMGKDKLTFVLSDAIKSFGYWAEQLIAESTGKEGKGIVPINAETLGAPDTYGTDRIFVHTCLTTDNCAGDSEKLDALEAAGHPVVRIKIHNKLELGGEYYRWEIATAIAGLVIGINPFDQPNVAESKKNTEDLLKDWQAAGAFKMQEPILQDGGLSFFAGNDTILTQGTTAGDIIAAFTSLAKPNDYIALLPYFMMTESREQALQGWREQMRTKLKVATTLLNGPRYLHSTGQLHKGGPGTGLYIILVSDEGKELPIHDEKYGFTTLHEAQSLGDFRSLSDKGRRVIRINLGKDIDSGLQALLSVVHKTNK